ncbi:phosphoribosyltransferase family protein [Winogradskyella tangerina]|uniref:phosphoribosyltransferase family protein n=1 Tax=Winogradskyella tangerina TaxID=2023240 RepID=UPI00130034CE|nr:phosphoribosyltransferase family protein [Winogradskyella tangerina]
MKCCTTLPDCDVIAGVANSGTQWAAILSDRTNLEFANILKEPRESGMKRQVEGVLEGKRVILVDNCAESGISMLNAIEVVKAHGGIPVGVLLISGNDDAEFNFGVEYAYAFSVQLLMESAEDLGLKPKHEIVNV